MDPTLEPFITDDLKADPVAWPILEKMQEKSVTDVLKGYAHSQHRLGSAVPLLNGDAKPEDIVKWKEQHLPRLQKAGLIDTPAKLPEKYDVKLPDNFPKEAWTEESNKRLGEYAKKHGLSQEAVNDGLGFLIESIGGFHQSVKVNQKASAEKLKAAIDAEGVPVEQFDAALERFRNDPKLGWDAETTEAMVQSGWADHPGLNYAIYKIMKDSGTFDTRNDGGSMDQPNQDAAAATAEANDIIRNKTNPKYVLYHKGDKDVNAYVQNLLKKGIPGTLEI